MEVPTTPSDFRYQLQVLLVACTSDQLAINQRFHDLLGAINLLGQLAELRTILLTRSPVYCIKKELRKTQVEDMHRAMYGDRAWSFQVLSRWSFSLNLHVYTNLEALNANLLGIYGGSID